MVAVNSGTLFTQALMSDPPKNFEEANNSQNLMWGHRYILSHNHSYTFPPVTQTGGTEWIGAIPANNDWSAFIGTWNTTGTDTIGATQGGAVATFNQEITLVGKLNTTGPNDIIIYS